MENPVLGLATWLRRVSERYPQRPALTFDDVTWRYAEFQQRIVQCAATLAEGGIGAGDRVGYLGFNDPMFLVAMFATARLGAIFVPLNFRLTGPEIAFIVRDAGVHTLIVDAAHRPVIDRVRSELSCRRWFAVESGPGATPASAAEAPSDAQSDAGTEVGWEPLPAFDPALAAAAGAPDERAVAADDVALIMYTSGTTGQPKGAMLTHGNFWSNNLNGQHALSLRVDDVLLNFAPLFHVGGLCSISLPGLQMGGHLILQRGWDVDAVLKVVPQYRVTVGFAVPSMLLFLSQHADFASADLSSLRSVSVGGAPMPEPLLALYARRGIPVNQGFGMTETTATVCLLVPERARDKLGSSGTAALLCEMRLTDAQGREITAPEARGELCIRGGNVMLGYWNRPEATAAVFDGEGWFHSGDVAYFDAEGFLYVCDRLKDMVISGGENVYPAEVESVLYEHPAIAEVAVIGAPDERWGERVVAVVALRPGMSLTLEALQAFGRERLAGYKLPRELRFIDALPRNPTGKVVKARLRTSGLGPMATRPWPP